MATDTMNVIRMNRFGAKIVLVRSNQPARNSSVTLARTASPTTGKKMASRAIDDESAQALGPTATLNYGALPRGLFENGFVPSEEAA
jgi:transcriptional regulator of acetoin/glycerol metabolism